MIARLEPMRRLAAWPGHRIFLVWLGWFGLLVGLMLFQLARQIHHYRMTVSQQPQTITDSGSSRPAPRNDSRGHLELLPEQHTDFVYSVVVEPGESTKAGLVLLVPPGLLTALWVYARRRTPKSPS
jgi:hypothetical protein